MEDLNRVFIEWVQAEVKDEKVKEYLLKQKGSYFAWLVFFLRDTIHKIKK